MRDSARILAAGPWQKGPMDRPHRLVLVEWRTPSEKLDQFSVHTQHDHPEGPLANGAYYVFPYGKTPEGPCGGLEIQKLFETALAAFMDKLAVRLRNSQIQWCWMYEPAAPPKG